jgi:hypothetical protein
MTAPEPQPQRLWLKAYALGAVNEWSIEPAPPKRRWMDETYQKIAYRCLPLIAANQAGWVVRCPASFTAIWSGRIDNYGIRLAYEPDSAHLAGTALSHFGSGVLTFVLPWLFRTPPGIGLLVRGMTNETKDNAVALDGVVETDWSPYTFTINWRILRPEVAVQFKKGDAVCMLQPFPLDLLERFDCTFESAGSLPADLRKGFDDFAHKRSAAAVVAPQGGYQTQRDYFAGRYPDGSPARYPPDPIAAGGGTRPAEASPPSPQHRIGFDLKPFVD